MCGMPVIILCISNHYFYRCFAGGQNGLASCLGSWSGGEWHGDCSTSYRFRCRRQYQGWGMGRSEFKPCFISNALLPWLTLRALFCVFWVLLPLVVNNIFQEALRVPSAPRGLFLRGLGLERARYWNPFWSIYGWPCLPKVVSQQTIHESFAHIFGHTI